MSAEHRVSRVEVPPGPRRRAGGGGLGWRWSLRPETGIGAENAFTLIEILVVVAIMGIVLTISVPFLNTAITGNKGLNGAMRMVQEACSDARALAIMRQSVATLTVNIADSSFNVAGGAGSGGGARSSSPDVAGNEWRMADAAPASGTARGGRVEMRHKYPVKLPDGVLLEAVLARGLDASELEMVEIRFYPDGTSDEFNVVLTHPESGDSRQVWLEITTGLPDFETDRTKFNLH